MQYENSQDLALLTIRSKRTIIEPIQSMDKKGFMDFCEYSIMPEFYRYFEYPAFRSRDEVYQYIEKLNDRINNDGDYYWIIKEVSHKKVIGTFSVRHIDLRKMCAEIGYGISPAYWNKGYFNEVLNEMINQLSTVYGFHRLSALTHSDNYPSISALIKVGFVREGTMRDFLLTYKGERKDAEILSFLPTRV